MSCHSGVWNQYPTSCTFTGVLFGLLAVAFYIYHIYYNNTLFALFLTILNFQLSQYNKTSPLICCLFSFPLLIFHLYTFSWVMDPFVKFSESLWYWDLSYYFKIWVSIASHIKSGPFKDLFWEMCAFTSISYPQISPILSKWAGL